MEKYRRIEVHASHGRVTILSGEWPRNMSDALPSQNEGVLPNDREAGENVAPDSPQGQLILLEAVRSLEQRLSPETLAAICAELVPPAATVTDDSLRKTEVSSQRSEVRGQLSPHENKKEK